MTTIAYRDGIMACDSCWAHENMQTTSLIKIDRLKSGALLGSAGDCDIRALIKLLDDYDDMPPVKKLRKLKIDFAGLIVKLDGRVFHLESCAGGANEDDLENYDAQIWPNNMPFASVGSGSKVALGAMAAGKSAAEAVAIACQFDINSREPVHQVALNKVEP